MRTHVHKTCGQFQTMEKGGCQVYLYFADFQQPVVVVVQDVSSAEPISPRGIDTTLVIKYLCYTIRSMHSRK